jgi:hypothetical protein
MLYLESDPDGIKYYDTPLPAKTVDYKTFSGIYFNRDFQFGRFTDWEINYLNDLIEEYKDTETSRLRRNEIWRSLNWAPIQEQFAFVLDSKYESLYSKNAVRNLQVSDSRGLGTITYSGYRFFAEPLYEKWSGVEFDVGIDIKGYDEGYNRVTTVPAFVLHRSAEKWKGGTSIKFPFGDGTMQKINLDSVIRAKNKGWKYNGQEIPDQEIVHYIRRKYGISHTLNQSYNSEIVYPAAASNAPQIRYYTIPFYNDEIQKPSRLGKKIDFGLQIIDKNYTFDKKYTDKSYADASDPRKNSIPKYDEVFNYYMLDMKNHNKIISDTVSRDRDKTGTNNWQMSWNQIIYFSQARAHWRASKFLIEIVKFSKMLEHGIDDKTILPLASESYEKDKDGNTITQYKLVYVSGKSSGESKEHEEKTYEVQNHEPKHEERPWNHIMEYSEGGTNSYASDMNFKSKGECFTKTRYMRHLLIPEISPYISEELYDNNQILYTYRALDNRLLFYHPLLEGFRQLNFSERSAINNATENGKIIDKTQLGGELSGFIKYLKKYKTTIFVSVVSSNIILESIANSTHSAIKGTIAYNVGHYAAIIAHVLEAGLTTYKVSLNLKLGYYDKALKDLIVYCIITFGLPRAGLSHTWGGFAVSTVIIISSFIYDKYVDSKKKADLIHEFENLITEATKYNYLEGPYAQSGGTIKIKKGPNGELPIKATISDDGKTITNEYENFQTQTVEKTSDNLNREQINKRFLESGGDGERTFFSQITKEECTVLLDIAGSPRSSDGRYNPILNSAPNIYDLGLFRKSIDRSENVVGGVFHWSPLDFYFKFGSSVAGKQQDFESIMYLAAKSKIGIEQRLKYSKSKLKAASPVGNIIDESVLIKESRIAESPYDKYYGPLFKYNNTNITRSTNLSEYFKGEKLPTSRLVRWTDNVTSAEQAVRIVNTPHLIKFNIIVSKYWSGPFNVTDKEKISLIRRKYGLDRVISEKSCCIVGDIDIPYSDLDNIFPPDKPLKECEYLIDFASREFIKKLEEWCKKNESKDKEEERTHNADVDNTNIGTQHGDVEEHRVKEGEKQHYKKEEDKRRQKKRETTARSNYEGTSMTNSNLSQLPRLGREASIAGQVNNDTPLGDIQTSQQLFFEAVDTENTDGTLNFVLFLIDLYGNINNLMAQQKWRIVESASTPIEPGRRILIRS